MPLSFNQIFLSSLFVIGLGAFIFLSCGAFIGHAVAQQRSDSTGSLRGVLPWLLFGVIAIWFGAAIATSTTGLISLSLVLQFTLFPIILGFPLSFTPQITNIIKKIPAHWLVRLQIYRVAGAIFIYPFMVEGVITREFALGAGIGDILTGLLAIPVALLIMQDGKRWRWVLYAWTAFGILDLLLAMAIAGTFGFAVQGEAPNFPITAVPLFYGPPFSILLHLITLRSFNLRHNIALAKNN